MSEHTKTPWVVYTHTDGPAIIYSEEPRRHVLSVNQDDDARHIVHCVNNHERLVDMVAELDELVCYYHGCFPLDRVTEKQRRLNDTMVKARALLAELDAGEKGDE